MCCKAISTIQGEFYDTYILHNNNSHFAGCLRSLKLLVEVIHLLQLVLIQ